MSMYGADVAQLRSLAAQFDRTADQLDANRMAVGNAIQISAWVGPFATQFRLQWNSDHSSRIHGAATLLRTSAQNLRRNADDQERASAVDGGTRAGGDSSGSRGGSVPTPDRNPWQQAIDALRDATTLGGLKPWQIAELGAKMGDLMDAKVGWFGGLNTGMDAIDVFSGIASGKPEWDKIIHLGADGLGKIRNPITQLVSLNVHVWTDVVVEAGKADFSAEGMATVGNYIAENPMAALDEVGKATVEVGRRLVGWLPI